MPKASTTKIIDDEVDDETTEKTGPEVNDDDLDEPVDVPPAIRYGNFQKVGQSYDGLTVDFTSDEGKNAKDEPCPEIKLRLLKLATVYRNGDPIEVPAGEEITITAGQYLLAKALLSVNPQPGERVKIAFEGMQGQTKIIKVYPSKKRSVSYDDLKAATNGEGKPPY